MTKCSPVSPVSSIILAEAVPDEIGWRIVPPFLLCKLAHFFCYPCCGEIGTLAAVLIHLEIPSTTGNHTEQYVEYSGWSRVPLNRSSLVSDQGRNTGKPTENIEQ
jgi:hypothetical protein